MEFNELIRKFAERFGIDVPEIVDDAAAFDADGMPFLVMRVADEGESEYLVIAADLGEPPPERMEKLYEALLDAGHAFAWAGGGVFARNPADGHIWLQLREAYASIDVESAIAKVKALGDAALTWRDIIREYREGSSIPEPATAGETPAKPSGDELGGEGPPGFMMV
jgi:hypothetical protein